MFGIDLIGTFVDLIINTNSHENPFNHYRIIILV